MKIMSINAGSSSLKFSLFNMETEEVIATGLFERIGFEHSAYKIKYNGTSVSQEVELKDHKEAAKILLTKLVDLEIIGSLDEIEGIGHRIVHGGPNYTKTVLITDKVIEDLKNLTDFAPLHNPAHVLGIEALKEALPDTLMTVVFDTAFHQTMDEVSYLYATPMEWYTKHAVRKYGFHGTSHRYIAKTISEELKRDDLRIINCHLGNGGSVCAISNGECRDTSMGFTPLAGIVMGTRSGDIDPAIIPYIMEKEGLNAGEVVDALNKKSGFLGISGLSNDSRDIEEGALNGNERCALTQKKFVRSVVNYIAQYYVLLGGCDVLCFTAGIGENSISVRQQIVEQLSCLGFKIDVERNNVRGQLQKISSDSSEHLIYVVPTNEELLIARDTLELLQK